MINEPEPAPLTEMEKIVYWYHVIVYNLDLFTDIGYYVMIPFYKDIMFISVILCTFLPIVIQEVKIRLEINPGGGCKNCKICCVCPTIKGTKNALLHAFGFAPMMYRKKSEDELLTLWLEESVFAGIPVFIL